jgi:ribonuclease P protein component
VAFAVSRRCGGAVQRNKIRRRLRGAVGELADGLLPGTYLVRTDPAVAATSYQELVGRLRECLARIAELSKEGTR